MEIKTGLGRGGFREGAGRKPNQAAARIFNELGHPDTALAQRLGQDEFERQRAAELADSAEAFPDIICELVHLLNTGGSLRQLSQPAQAAITRRLILKAASWPAAQQ